VHGPSWIGEDRFDIQATLPPNTTPEKVPLMLRSLLIARFQMTSHWESESRSTYVLMIAKNGPRLRKSSASSLPDRPLEASGTFDIAVGTPNSAGSGSAKASHMTVSGFADLLSRLLKEPVRDLTGIAGEYEFDLQFAAEDAASLAQALEERLGLKLERGKSQVEVLVIDHVRRVPTAN